MGGLPGTVKAFKERNKLGRFADQLSNKPVHSSYTIPETLKLDARVQIRGEEGVLERRGTVRFVGETKFGKQDGTVWVGVDLDEPVGKNSGS